MAGQEIAKIFAKVSMDTTQIDKSFKLLKGGLQDADAKLMNFKTAVANSATALTKSQIALSTYQISMKQATTVTAEMKQKEDALKLAVLQNTTALKINKSALAEYQAQAAISAGTTSKLGSAMTAMGVSATTLVVGALVAVAAGLTAIIGKSTQISSEFEQLGVSFEVLAGGKEAGDALVTSLTNLANVTPMTTQGLANNAKLLLSFGESTANIIPDLKLLGDISGGNQEKMNSLALAFAQSGSAGRLMGQDLLQMVNAGFNPLQEISAKTGKSMGQLRKEMEAGLIPFSQVKQAFIDATSEGGRFYGMMDKQSKTLNGRLSTMADKWGLVSKAIGDIFLPAAKKAVDILVNMADNLINTSDKGNEFSQRLNEIKTNLEVTTTNISTLIIAFKGLREIIGQLIPGTDNFNQLITTMNSNFTKLGLTLSYVLAPLKVLKKEFTFEDVRKDWDKTSAKWRGLDNSIFKQKTLNFSMKSSGSKQVKKEVDSVQSGFRDSGSIKSSGGGRTRSTATSSAPSPESLLSQRISLIKAQSDLEIAQSKYTDEQILQKKISTQNRITALYKKGSVDYIQAQTESLNLSSQLDELRVKSAEDSAKKQADALKEVADKNKQTAQELTNDIGQAFRGIVDGTKTVSQAFGDMFTNIIGNFLQSKLQSAIEGMLNSFTGTAKPIQQVSQSISTMGMAAPVAATGIQTMGVALTASNGAITGAAAPAMALGTSYGSMAQQAQMAAISTANLAIAQAAETTAMIPIVGGFLAGPAATMTGAGIGIGSAVAGAGMAAGSAMGSFKGFANGGNPDTTKPFIAGERGAELIVPSNKTKVFTNKETQGIMGGSSDSANGQSIQPILVNNTFKVETMQGDNAIKTLQTPESRAAIQKIMKDAIRLNQGGVRNEVKNV